MESKTGDQQTVQTMVSSQWLGLISISLLIPFMLLVCGGHLGWWQAWVYAFLFVVASIGGRIWAERKHPGLLAERVNFEKAQEAKSWDKVLAPLMVVSLYFPPVIVAGLDHRFGWSPVFPTWLTLLGFILIAWGYSPCGHWWRIASSQAWSGFRRIEDIWCVTLAPIKSYDIRAMLETYCHSRAWCWP